MSQIKVVLDTNGLLRSVSRKSQFAIVLDKLFAGEYELIVTADILLEYEEKISEIFSKEVAERIIGAFYLLPNIRKVDVYFQFNLISKDWDDNKFTDCALAGNAHYIVTDDKHFKVLATVGWPKLQVLSLAEFKDILTSKS